MNFNPRPPCGGRPFNFHIPPSASIFQSTPPVWGATGQPAAYDLCGGDFNPRPPCGGRLDRIIAETEGATRISIHAPRVGGDPGQVRRHNGRRHFNPRPPCGGRQMLKLSDIFLRRFQSTPPVWGATLDTQANGVLIYISIHAPRVGGDTTRSHFKGWQKYFNPRPPCGGRLEERAAFSSIGPFQSTPPVWGATTGPCSMFRGRGISIHAPRVGGDLALLPLRFQGATISIHAPRVGGD